MPPVLLQAWDWFQQFQRSADQDSRILSDPETEHAPPVAGKIPPNGKSLRPPTALSAAAVFGGTSYRAALERFEHTGTYSHASSLPPRRTEGGPAPSVHVLGVCRRQRATGTKRGSPGSREQGEAGVGYGDTCRLRCRKRARY